MQTRAQHAGQLQLPRGPRGASRGELAGSRQRVRAWGWVLRRPALRPARRRTERARRRGAPRLGGRRSSCARTEAAEAGAAAGALCARAPTHRVVGLARGHGRAQHEEAREEDTHRGRWARAQALQVTLRKVDRPRPRVKNCFDGCGRASLCKLNAAKVTLVKRLDSAPRGQLVTTARRAAEGRVARRLGLARG